MRPQPPLIHQPLHSPIRRLRQLPNFHIRLPIIRLGPLRPLTRNQRRQDPVRLDDLALGSQMLRVRVQRDILPARASDRAVTYFERGFTGDAVDGVFEVVARGGPDVGCAGRRAVVEDFVGAVGAD